MSSGYQPAYAYTAASAPASARAAFIKRTYLHLAGAVLAFVGLEAVLFTSGAAEQILRDVFMANQFSWIALMVLFIAGGFAAQRMARAQLSPGVQYAGLALYVLLEVVIFLPLLYFATEAGGILLPLQAGILTIAVFGGLTAGVFWSGKDFSFLGPIIWVGSWLALGLVIAAVIGGFSMGLVFCGAMVALAAASIIYNTSNIIHQYGPDEYVAASLSLFASVALLFWYILRIFMISRDD